MKAKTAVKHELDHEYFPGIEKTSNGKTRSFIPDLIEMNEIEINEWMTRFVLEARRKDGGPPRSLYQHCVGLLRYNRKKGNDSNFLDNFFLEIRRALSANITELTTQGIGTVKSRKKMENSSWRRMFWEIPLQNQYYIQFFLNCKLFGLRGVDEHRNFSFGQRRDLTSYLEGVLVKLTKVSLIF